MAVAQGQCPGCGAPITFSAGSSISAVCQYCNTTVRRTDRGLENLGKVAALADTPGLVAVGDSGTIGDKSFVVLGKVQMQHDMGGVWDEWYIGFSDGQWGWLAYAQGIFMVTWKVDPPPPVPDMSQMKVDMDVSLGDRGNFRVVELKQATVASAQGELPFSPKSGDVRYYADLEGPNSGFATIDWGSGSDPVEVFIGYQLLESQIQITQQAERPTKNIELEGLNCPGCGAPLRVRGGQRIERIACEYCGTISETATQQIIAKQEEAMGKPTIPLGSTGTLPDGIEYTVIGYMKRSTVVDDEKFYWEEYLLFSKGLGFRWLVVDEGVWRFVLPLNAADVDNSNLPNSVTYGGNTYTLTNQGTGRVEYVLGEFYWKVKVGETVESMDFVNGSKMVSREFGQNEVHYSFSNVIDWSVVASAFGVSPSGDGVEAGGSSESSGSGMSSGQIIVFVIVALIVLLVCGLMTCGSCGSCGSGGGYSGGGGTYYRGGGWSGGK